MIDTLKKTTILNCRLSISILLILSLFFSVGAYSSEKSALDEDMSAEQVHELLIAQFGIDKAEAYMAMIEIREKIEENSYMNTMALCEGYRRFSGLGPISILPAYLKKIHSSNYEFDARAYRSQSEENYLKNHIWKEQSSKVKLKRDSLRESVNSDGYYFDLDEHTYAFSKVFYSGGQSVFEDFFGGAKAQHNLVSNRALLDVHSWFGSVYFYYLLRSSGGTKAMVHCLGYDEAGYFRGDRINSFMQMLQVADTVGGSVAHTITGGALGKLFGIALKLVGKTKVWKFFANSFNKTWASTRGKVLVIGGSLVASAYGLNYLMELDKKLDLHRKVVSDMQSTISEGLGLQRSDDDLLFNLQLALKSFTKLVRIKNSVEQESGEFIEKDYIEYKVNYEESLKVTIKPYEKRFLGICKHIMSQPEKDLSNLDTNVMDAMVTIMPQAKVDLDSCFQSAAISN